VPALARGDAERLLRFVAEAENFGDVQPFAGEFLTQLGRLVPADWIGYYECYGCPGDRGGFHFARPGDEQIFSAVDWEAVNRVRGAEDPVLGHLSQGRFDAVKASDFLTRHDLHRTQLYELALKPYGLEDMLGVRLRVPPPSRPKQFGFDRGGHDFSARDCAVLDFLNLHLLSLDRASENRRRLCEALALHESTRTAVVLLEADDRVAFASSAARQLIDWYFGERGARLPDSLLSWLRERRRAATQEPLRIDGGIGCSWSSSLTAPYSSMSGAGCPLSQRASGRSSISLPRAGRTLKSLSVYGSRVGPSGSTSTTSTPSSASTREPQPWLYSASGDSVLETADAYTNSAKFPQLGRRT
jgi:hypothetical protein